MIYLGFYLSYCLRLCRLQERMKIKITVQYYEKWEPYIIYVSQAWLRFRLLFWYSFVYLFFFSSSFVVPGGFTRIFCPLNKLNEWDHFTYCYFRKVISFKHECGLYYSPLNRTKTNACFDIIVYGLLMKCYPLIVDIFRQIVLNSVWLNKSTDISWIHLLNWIQHRELLNFYSFIFYGRCMQEAKKMTLRRSRLLLFCIPILCIHTNLSGWGVCALFYLSITPPNLFL